MTGAATTVPFGGALEGVRVVDFTTLLPGPFATLILAEAGAHVTKIEAPAGDPLRANKPHVDGTPVSFALLNRGKDCRRMDLKDPGQRASAERLILDADIVVEQFRPGVMDRLGLGYKAMSALKPDLIYCSITGYGQDGPDCQLAGHDLNYLARSGILSLGGDGKGHPVLPPTQIADIGGGAMPAVVNILTALLQRNRTGRGAHLDVAMSEGVLGWSHGSFSRAICGETEPGPGFGRLFGGSPRYQLYETRDGRFLSVAPLEEKFWKTFCATIGLTPERIEALGEGEALIGEIATILQQKTCEDWMALFQGKDVCVEPVRRVDEALKDEHFNSRAVFDQQIELASGKVISALPVPLAKGLRKC